MGALRWVLLFPSQNVCKTKTNRTKQTNKQTNPNLWSRRQGLLESSQWVQVTQTIGSGTTHSGSIIIKSAHPHDTLSRQSVGVLLQWLNYQPPSSHRRDQRPELEESESNGEWRPLWDHGMPPFSPRPCRISMPRPLHQGTFLREAHALKQR